jgi:hypothetical protein
MTYASPHANPCESLIASHDGMNAVTEERAVIQLASRHKPLRLQRQFFSARARLRCRAPHSEQPHGANTFV